MIEGLLFGLGFCLSVVIIIFIFRLCRILYFVLGYMKECRDD